MIVLKKYVLDLPSTPSGMVSRGAKVLLIGLLGMFCQGTQLPLPKPNDSADGVHVSPKVRLRDGRYLAYREKGVPKDQAKHIIIIVHGFGSSKDMNFLAPQVYSITSISLYKTCLCFVDLKTLDMLCCMSGFRSTCHTR